MLCARLAALTLAALGLGVAVTLLIRGEPAGALTLLRNNPPVVEQQTGTGCALDLDLSDCVTNDGPCIWDADDALWTYLGTPRPFAPGASLSLQVCVFSDWLSHFAGMRAYHAGPGGGQAKPYRLSITVDPPGKTITKDTTTKDSVSLCTQTTDYDRQAILPEVPYQGGGGGVLGHAVPTTVTFTITNTGKRAIIQQIVANIEVSWGDNIIGCVK